MLLVYVFGRDFKLAILTDKFRQEVLKRNLIKRKFFRTTKLFQVYCDSSLCEI
jgi:hypothetical protein